MSDTIRQFVSFFLITLLLSPGPLAAQQIQAQPLSAGGVSTIEGTQVPLANRQDTTAFPVPPAVQDLQYAVTPTDVYLNWADILPKHIYSPDAAFVVYRKEVGKDTDFVLLTSQPIVRINSPAEQPASWPARLGNFHDAFQTTLPLRLQQMVTAPVPPAQIRSLEATPRLRSEIKPPSVSPQGSAMQAQSAAVATQAETASQPMQTTAQVSAARSMVATSGSFTYERFQNVLDRRADRGLLLATFHPPSAVMRGVGYFDTTVEAGKHYLYRVEMITGTPEQGVFQQGGRLVFLGGEEFPPAGALPIPSGTHYVIGQTTKEIVAGQVTAPPAPTNLKVEEGVERIYLSWDLVPDSEGYSVYRAEAGSNNFVLLTPQPVVPIAQLAQGRLGVYSAAAERSALLQQTIATSSTENVGTVKPIAKVPLISKGATASTARLATMGLPGSIAGISMTAPRAESMAQAKIPAQLKNTEDRVQLGLAQHLLLPSYYYLDSPPDVRKSYIYKVASRDLVGQGNNSATSDPHHAHHIPAPPSRVQNATQPTDRGVVRLAWDAVSDPLVDSLNVHIADATLENPGGSQVVANLPAGTTHYDFVTKQVRHPFQFYVTAVGVTHDAEHPDESKTSDRVTASARKLELPAPPIEVTVTPLQSADQLNNDPSLKVVDVVISWRVKEADPDLAGFRILKSSTPGNPDGLKFVDQYHLAAAQFAQANPGIIMKSVAPQMVVPPSVAMAGPAATAAQKSSVVAARPSAAITPKVPQMTVTQVQTQTVQAAQSVPASQTQAAMPSGARARIVQPFNLRPDVVAAPKSEVAKGIVALLARETPPEQTIGTVVVDEFTADAGGVMKFNPVTRAALTSKFGFRNAVSPMLFYKPVSGVSSVRISQPAVTAAQRSSMAAATTPASNTPTLTGVSAGQNSTSASSNTSGLTGVSAGQNSTSAASNTPTLTGVSAGQNSTSASSNTSGLTGVSAGQNSTSASSNTSGLTGVSAGQNSTSAASNTSGLTGTNAGQTFAAARSSQAAALSAVKPSATVTRETLAPQLLKKMSNVSIAYHYQFIEHIPISSRNVQYYRISSYDQGYVESSFSDKIRFTLASYIKPYPPRLVHLELTDDRKVNLTWKGIPETDFSGFNVYRTDSGNPGAVREKLNASPLGFQTTSFVDETPAANKRSFYLITTVNTEGLESDASNLISVMLPPAPENLSAQNLQASWNATAVGVQLDWQPPVAPSGGTARTDIIGYVVFRDPGPKGAAPAKPSETGWGIAISPLLTTTQFIDPSLTSAGTYNYRVVAFTADEGGLPPAAVAVNVSAAP